MPTPSIENHNGTLNYCGVVGLLKKYNIMKTRRLLLLSLALSFSTIAISQKWSNVNKVVQDFRNSGEYFGNAVDIDGDYAIAGAHWEDLDSAEQNFISNAGAAFILKKENGVWGEHQKLVAWDRLKNADTFGCTVAMEGDFVFVGSRNDFDEFGGNEVNGAGAVYIFKRNPATDLWEQFQKITAVDRNEGFANFGFSGGLDGAISVEGNTLVVGAYYESEDENELNPINNAGAVYHFEYNTVSSTWDFMAKIVAPVAERNSEDKFGWVVDLEGSWLAISAYNHRPDMSGIPREPQNGAVFMYENVAGDWTYRHKIIDHFLRLRNESFAYQIKIEGDIMAISEPYDKDDENGMNPLPITSEAGGVFLYKRNGSTWNFYQKLVAPDRLTDQGQRYGMGLAMSGNYMAVAASSNKTDENGLNRAGGWNTTGAVFIYQRDAGADTYSFFHKVVPFDRDLNQIATSFGALGSLEMDGLEIMVGAYSEQKDENGNGTAMSSAGAVYFFYPPPSYDTIDTTLCYKDSILIYGVYEKTTGIYYDTLSYVIGPDSVLQTYNLTVLDAPVNYSDTVYLADGDSAFIDGNWHLQDTIISFTLPFSGTGCDSAFVDSVLIVNVLPTVPPEVKTEVEMPNIFTPNGDDINDFLLIKHESGIEMDVTIFNRWGAIEYQAINTNPWDGKNNGKEVVEGTYFVTVKGIESDGDEFEYSGHVTLKR